MADSGAIESAVPLARLAEWMDGVGLAAGAPLEAPELLKGGTQNILLRFERGGRSFVLRRPPLHLRPNSNVTMQREARVLKALRGSRVPHPGFVAACDDESVLGAKFYLMEAVDGFCARDHMPSLHASDASMRRQMGFEMASAIAELANVDYVAADLSDFGRTEGYLERQVSRWSSQLANYADFKGWPGPSSLPKVAQIGEWLSANKPISFRPGLIHGDFHFGNVLYDWRSARLAAVVDWELATLGDPLLDLGGLLMFWPKDGAVEGPVEPWRDFPTRSELIESYGARTGFDVSNIRWYEVLACYKLALILEGTYARACAGLAPVEIGRTLHESAIARLQSAAELIES